MCSPVGHTLGGFIAGAPPAFNWRWLLFILLAANAPDLDFLAGALVGEFNRYHHMASHSIMASAIFMLLVFIVLRLNNSQSFKAVWLGGLAYNAHLLLDCITIDSSAPRGMQLFWPFTEQYFIAPFTFFTNIQHGGRNDTVWEALGPIFSMHNLGAVFLELAVLLPIFLFMQWRKRT